MEGKTHDLNHDLTFSAHTFNCVCHSIRSMFRVLGIDNFGDNSKQGYFFEKKLNKFFVEPYKIKLFPAEYYRGCPKKKIGCMQDLTPLDG